MIERKLRISFEVITLLIGVTISQLSRDFTGSSGELIGKLGLALIVTGCISLLQEIVFSSGGRTDVGTGAKLDKIEDGIKQGFDKISGYLMGGIHMIAPERSGHPSYHKWVLEDCPQEMFFAGHSVLHRMQKDHDKLKLAPVSDALVEKVRQGSNIRILFLDPTWWPFLGDIAKDEAQEPAHLANDLKDTLNICNALWTSLNNNSSRLPGRISICTCRELTQYAYHLVRCDDRKTSEVLVGLYFAKRKGTDSPLFVVNDEEIREHFYVHFKTIFNKAKLRTSDNPSRVRALLEYGLGGNDCFDSVYYQESIAALAKVINAYSSNVSHPQPDAV